MKSRSLVNNARLTFRTKQLFREWLEVNYENPDGFYLVLSKVSVPKDKRNLTYVEAREVALCYGWVDGHKKSLDASSFLQRVTHRRPKSNWSKVNKGLVEAYMDLGIMHENGVAEVERAKQDGRWDMHS